MASRDDSCAARGCRPTTAAAGRPAPRSGPPNTAASCADSGACRAIAADWSTACRRFRPAPRRAVRATAPHWCPPSTARRCGGVHRRVPTAPMHATSASTTDS